MSTDWQSDAELAGTLYRKSKPFTSMLIARCVEPGEGQGARQPRSEMNKVSAREFAEHADISPVTALKYLRTWDAMAGAGIVPPRDELEPGEDVELPDMKVWMYYYKEANPPKPSKPKLTPEHEPGVLDLKGRVDIENKRVQSAFRRINRPNDDVPENVAIPVRRVVEALENIGFGNNPNREFVAAVVALGDLMAALGS